MRPLKAKRILQACQMAFDGTPVSKIALFLDVSEGTIGGWRKTDIWIEFEQELIDAHKQSVLETYRETVPLENSTQ